MESGDQAGKGRGKEKATCVSEWEEAEGNTDDSGNGKKRKEKQSKKKKMEARRSKLFRETTARLTGVRSLGMLLKFRPLPNQWVVLEVPQDVDVGEFVRISHYAKEQGFAIAGEAQMMRLMLQRAQSMLVEERGSGEGGDVSGDRRYSDEGGQQGSERTDCSTTGGSSSV